MNNRLSDIIKYKTGGKQTEFAALMGWSPQYLAKLLKGDNFGITPVVKILSQFPDVSARWFLLGEGDMLSDDGISSLRRVMHERMLSILEVEKYMPIMSGDELRDYEHIITGNKEPIFSPDTVDKWEDYSMPVKTE